MQTTYTVQADNFDAWASCVKSTFQGKTLRIIIDDTPLEEASNGESTDFADRDGLDETEYLMRSEANKQHLLTALENVKAGRNTLSRLKILTTSTTLKSYGKFASVSLIRSRKSYEENCL